MPWSATPRWHHGPGSRSATAADHAQISRSWAALAPGPAWTPRARSAD